MSSRYHHHHADDAMDLTDLSDAEEIYAIGEADNTQRDYYNRRLREAINYLAEEGGQDSPATYMSRVYRIDEALVQLLPQTGSDYDRQLYRTVRAMVDEVHEEYDNAKEEINLQTRNAELDAAYYTPYTPSVSEALYREEEDLPEPSTRYTRKRPTTSMKSLPREQAKSYTKLQQQQTEQVSASQAVTPLGPRSHDSQDNVDFERSYEHSGPNSAPERWYRDMPACLPFPETHQMEAWETLKINFDISDYGKKLKAEGKVVETNIPFNHPALAKYKNLPHYESGSRFKLPHGRQEDYDRIRRLATEELLAKTVKDFNEDIQTDAEVSGYAPHAFLGRFSTGKQVSPEPDLPTALRGALSTTPTKSSRSRAAITPRTTSSKTAATKAATLKTAIEARKSNTKPIVQISSPSHESSQPKNPTPAGQTTRAGAAMRKFSDSRKQALCHSPRRESLLQTALRTPESPSDGKSPPRPATPGPKREKSTPKTSTLSSKPVTSSLKRGDRVVSPKVGVPSPRVATSVLEKKPVTPTHSRLHKTTPSTTSKPLARTPIPVPTSSAPKPAPKHSIKRKRSLGSEYYTPDGKRRRSVGSEEFSPWDKTLRSDGAAKVGSASGSESDGGRGEGVRKSRASKAAVVGRQVKRRVVSERTVESVSKVRRVGGVGLGDRGVV
ncbi:hypothetical protein IAQ61_009707, partial [Plenodomus lingam]|uniref:Predicted protein n=1 Tax=Leptosphaeria maculans (strain JN3 / isolate v23.1.3 / race Av1-4-5-6-7-8) TaxID=985895 RepID=E4ZUW2_LEPMJ